MPSTESKHYSNVIYHDKDKATLKRAILKPGALDDVRERVLAAAKTWIVYPDDFEPANDELRFMVYLLILLEEVEEKDAVAAAE